MIHLSPRDLIKRITNFRVASHHPTSWYLFCCLPISSLPCRLSRRGRYGNGFELIESLARKGCSREKWDSGRWEWKSLTPCLNVSFFSQTEFLISWNRKISGEGNEMESNYRTEGRTSEKGENDTVDDVIAFNLCCRLMAWFWRVDAKGFGE